MISTQWLRAAMLLLLLGALTMAIRAGVLGYRAAASTQDDDALRPHVVRLNGAEKRRYAYRLRQLEQDLRRDPIDFEILLRLGQLHLQLAECDVTDKGTHLRQSRHYLMLANSVAQFRWEQSWVRGLLEAANAPNPMIDIASIPGDYGPPRPDQEAWIRMRLGFLEDQLRSSPREARLLRRLATSYVALYLVMRPGTEPRTLTPETGWVIVSDPREVQLLAKRYFQRALECSRTHEGRCRTLYGQAQLYRVLNQPDRAAALLDQFLTIQPNNWLVSMEAAGLSRQLGQAEKAQRYQALSARWRLPGWI